VTSTHFTLQEQEGTKWILVGAEVTESFNSQLDSKAEVTKGFIKLETVISFRRLRKVWETTVVPVEVSCINDNTTDRGTVTTIKRKL
jgi:hypothetical protein